MNSLIPQNHQEIIQRFCKIAQSPTVKDAYLRGPKGCGKTTLLRDFAAHLRHNIDSYPISVVVEWDLRVNTPLTDDAFRLQMGRKLAEALASSPDQEHQDLAKEMNVSDEYLSDIQNAFNYLKRPAAFVIDNHDAVLDMGDVSIGMWGQLNELLEAHDGHKKLRIFASSRVPLQELARNAQELGSPYFTRLDPVSVTPFDLIDLAKCLKSLEELQISLDASARQEILRWTGGTPALVMRVLESIEVSGVRTWGATQIDELAQSLEEDVETILIRHWYGAPIDVRNAFVALCQGKDKGGSDAVHSDAAKEMKRRGWTIQIKGEDKSGDKLIASCFAANYALRYGTKLSQLPSLFGKQSDWEKQFPELIKLRLSQVENADAELKNRILKSVNCLLVENDPFESLHQMRPIAQRAFTLIWPYELEDGYYIPAHWAPTIRGEEIPNTLGGQINILRMATGTESNARLTSHIEKPTYELLAQIKNAGDIYNHWRELGCPNIQFGFAAALCLFAVELCDALSRELPR